MNTNTASLPTAKLLRRPIFRRCLVAFLLSIVGLFVFFGFGETLGYMAGFISVVAYCLIAQFFLSLGHPQALRQDWPIILCLNFMVFLNAILNLTLEPGAAAHPTILILVAAALACSYAGAALAALIARIRTPAV
jgi:hypothetical protein